MDMIIKRHDQHLSKEDVPAYTDLSNFIKKSKPWNVR
jgi:hypothetical protein